MSNHPAPSLLPTLPPPRRLHYVNTVQWTLDYPDLDYPDLDYPDPRLSGSRTAGGYNDLRMRVVAVDKYMAAKSVVLSTEDRQVVGQGCLPLSSTLTPSLPCSQQLALLALFTATGKHIWPIISDFSLIRHGFPTTLAKGVQIIEGPLYLISTTHTTSLHFKHVIQFVTLSVFHTGNCSINCGSELDTPSCKK